MLCRYPGQSALIGLSRFWLSPGHREDISQRRICRCRLLPLLPLLRVSRHTGIKERCCSLKSFNGFSVRVDAQSDFAGAPVVGDSPPWKTRALIVGGNLSADRVQVSCICGLERLCDTTVEEVPVRRTQGSVSLLSELIVAKVVGTGTSSTVVSQRRSRPHMQE